MTEQNPTEIELELTGDFADDTVKMISAINVPKTIIPGHLDGEDVFVLSAIIETKELGESIIPLAVLLTDEIHNRLELPDDIEEIPPAMPMNGYING